MLFVPVCLPACMKKKRLQYNTNVCGRKTFDQQSEQMWVKKDITGNRKTLLQHMHKRIAKRGYGKCVLVSPLIEIFSTLALFCSFQVFFHASLTDCTDISVLFFKRFSTISFLKSCKLILHVRWKFVNGQ